MEKVQGQSIFQRTAYKAQQNARARFFNARVRFLARSMCVIPLDHYLTTPSSQPVQCIAFYVPTFFYNHQNQRRKLCTPHNFRRWFIIFSCPSQFSDPKGRRFESSRAYKKGRCIAVQRPFYFCHGSCLSIHFVTMYAAILAMTDTAKLIR